MHAAQRRTVREIGGAIAIADLAERRCVPGSAHANLNNKAHDRAVGERDGNCQAPHSECLFQFAVAVDDPAKDSPAKFNWRFPDLCRGESKAPPHGSTPYAALAVG
jgi:hypothetical protein